MLNYKDLQYRIARAMQDTLGKMITRKIQCSKTIVICGINPLGLKVMDIIRGMGRKINYFTSFHMEENDSNVGTQIISFDDLATLHEEETLICIAEPENARIIKALAEMGFREYIDFAFLHYPALFDPTVLAKHVAEIIQAFELLCDEESQQTFLSVLEYRITGDPMRLQIAQWPQYVHPIVKPREKDVIVDGGAFIGDTALNFARYLEKACTIFSFEPGAENHQSLLDTIKNNGLENVIIPVKAGLWDATGQLVFDDSLGSGARISGKGTNLIKVVDLNSFIQRVRLIPTLIKLDVEGAETRVLKGAEDFITRHLPRLQVCVYHLPADLWEIPLFLRRLSGKYRIFMGHHWLDHEENWNFCETVAYAIAE